MTLRCANPLIACLSSLACGLAIALGVVAPSTGVAQAADCMDRFPQGRFGILPSHPAVAKLALEGFLPLYLMKQPIHHLAAGGVPVRLPGRWVSHGRTP